MKLPRKLYETRSTGRDDLVESPERRGKTMCKASWRKRNPLESGKDACAPEGTVAISLKLLDTPDATKTKTKNILRYAIKYFQGTTSNSNSNVKA